MMLSSWETKASLPSPVGYFAAACTTNNSVIARPMAMRTMCCFMLPPADGRSRRGWSRPGSAFEEEFHLHAGKLDDVMVLERGRRRADLLAIHCRAVRALYMSSEVALRPARQHRHLHPGLAERRERLVQLELLSGVAAGEELDRAEPLRRPRGWGRGGAFGRRGGRPPVPGRHARRPGGRPPA